MTWLLLALALLSVFLGGFFSGAETGVYRVNAIRLRLRSDQGDSAAHRLRQLLEDRQALLAGMLIGTNVADYITAVCLAAFLARQYSELTHREIEFYTTMIAMPLIFVFGEIVPKNWFRQDADRLMPRCSLALAIIDRVFRLCGAVALLKWLTQRLLRWWHSSEDFEQAIHPRGEIISLLKEGVAEGTLTADQSRLVDGVLAVSSISVSSVMIPQARVVTIPVSATRQDILEVMRRHPYSRYPVRGGRRQEIVGIVNAYDVLADPQAEVASFLIQPLKLAPGISVAAALKQMREGRQIFGVIIDRWGNFLGIATAKDLVEEVVGDLAAW